MPLAPLPPPHPLDNEWYAYVDGQTYGPYSGHQLADFVKEGRIDGATQVMPIGSETWTRAAEDSQACRTIPNFAQAAVSATDFGSAWLYRRAGHKHCCAPDYCFLG